MCRNHVVPRAKLRVPNGDFSIPLNYFDIPREIKTSLGVLLEGTIDDCWNMDPDKSLSEPWIGVARLALLTKSSRRRTGHRTERHLLHPDDDLDYEDFGGVDDVRGTSEETEMSNTFER